MIEKIYPQLRTYAQNEALRARIVAYWKEKGYRAYIGVKTFGPKHGYGLEFLNFKNGKPIHKIHMTAVIHG